MTYPDDYGETYTDRVPIYSQGQLIEQGALIAQLAETVGDPKSTWFDRKRYEEAPAEALLDTWATIDPGIRADMYASWKMILDQNGVDDLRDYEIVLMSYQERDSKAYDAVRNGDSVVGPVWYDKYVLYRDNEVEPPTFGTSVDLSGRDVFGTRQAWTDDANLTLDQAKRIKGLVTQGLTVYEPNPLQSAEDNLMIAAQRSAMAASALLLAKATMAGLAGTTLSAGIGIGLRAVGGSAAWLFRGGVSTYYDAMATVERYGRAEFWEDELGVLDPKTAMRVSEFGQMVGMRMGTPVTDILVKAAGKTPFIGETAASVTKWGTTGWRAKWFLFAGANKIGGMVNAYFNADQIEEDRAVRDAEQGTDTPEVDEDASTSRSSRGAKLKEINRRKAEDGGVVDESSAGRSGRKASKSRTDSEFTSQSGYRLDRGVNRVNRFQTQMEQISNEVKVRSSDTAQLAYVAEQQQMIKEAKGPGSTTTTTTVPSTSGSQRGSRANRDNDNLGSGLPPPPHNSGDDSTAPSTSEPGPPPPPDPMDDIPEITMDMLRQVQLGMVTAQEALGVATLDEAVSALAMARIPGARWLGEGETRSEVEASGDYAVYEDPSSYTQGSENVRQIVMPVRPGGTPQGVIDAYNFQRERLVTEINSPPDNPFIRVPETYKRYQFGVRRKSELGGTMMPDRVRPKSTPEMATMPDYLGRSRRMSEAQVGPDYLGRTKPDEEYESPLNPYPGNRPAMSEDEAAFITRAQTNVRPLYEVTGFELPSYRESAIWDELSTMGPAKIFAFQDMARRAGFYQNDRPGLPGHMDLKDQEIMSELMGQANVDGGTYTSVLQNYAKDGDAWRRANQKPADARSSSGSGYVKAPFSVPTHLRSIPGEKTIAEEVKERFERKLGRKPRQDELDDIASELAGYYTASNQEELALYLAAYDGDNQGLLTGAQMERIEDPGAATSYDIADKWENEIDLNKRRETNSESFSRMLSATLGNRPSVGTLTSARAVTQIGRE